MASFDQWEPERHEKGPKGERVTERFGEMDQDAAVAHIDIENDANS